MKKLMLAMTVLLLSLALSACGGGAKEADVDLGEFYNEVLQESEWPDLVAMEGEPLAAFYPGLTELGLKQCVVNTAAITSVVGEIALVEAETEEDAKAAADIFQARIDYQVGDGSAPGGAFYPETVEGWKNNSQISVQGRYAMLAVGEGAGEAVKSFEALFA